MGRETSQASLRSWIRMKIKIRKLEAMGVGCSVGSTVPVDRFPADRQKPFHRAMGTIAPTEGRAMKDPLHPNPTSVSDVL